MDHTTVDDTVDAASVPDAEPKQRIRDAEAAIEDACWDLTAALHRAELTRSEHFPPHGDAAASTPTERLLTRLWETQREHWRIVTNHIRRLEAALRAVQRADPQASSPAQIAAVALHGREGAKRRNPLELSPAERDIVAQYREMDAAGRGALRIVAESLAETTGAGGAR